ncbi:hypothetical protein A2U01_0118638, partial [Trifolium medium]|nr:hypothetical protein [Trifolium medium]
MEHFEGWVKEINTKHKLFESQVMDLASKSKQQEGRVK